MTTRPEAPKAAAPRPGRAPGADPTPAAPESAAPQSKVLLVTGHPRPDSLTAQLVRRARERLTAEGHTVDLLDLVGQLEAVAHVFGVQLRIARQTLLGVGEHRPELEALEELAVPADLHWEQPGARGQQLDEPQVVLDEDRGAVGVDGQDPHAAAL